MTESQSAIVALLPVVVGGLLAIAGGAVTQWWLNKIKLDNEKKDKRATKFEELINAVYEFDHWLTVLSKIRVFGDDRPETATPVAKMKAIGFIYFPEFTQRIEDLEKLSTEYEVWMLEAAQKRLGKKDVSTIRDGQLDVYRPYARAREHLLNDLRKFGEQMWSK